MTRRYRKSAREESEAATRQRIVDATVDLHGSLGPRHTTISAIAKRAGVQRLTVYRHFPDEERLFEACTSCWAERHPLPDPSAWSEETDWARRLRLALDALYGHYARAGTMIEVALRDEPYVEAVKRPMAEFRDYLSAIADELIEAARANAMAATTIRHVLAFSTWKQLVDQGKSHMECVDLTSSWVICASRCSEAA